MALPGDDRPGAIPHGVGMQQRRQETPAVYEIHVEGAIDQRWSGWFDGMAITPAPGGTRIVGEVADQGALHGLLARVRDMGLPVVSVRRVAPTEPEEETP